MKNRFKDIVKTLTGNLPDASDDLFPENNRKIGQTVLGSLSADSLNRILRSAATGVPHDYLSLAETMEESDEHYRSQLSTRKMAVSSLEFTVEPYSDDANDVKYADAVRDILTDATMPDLVENLLDGIAKGYSVVRITWGTKDNLWLPVAYEHKDPRLFKMDTYNPETLLIDDNGNGVSMNPYDFIVFKPRLKSGLFIRSGLARVVAWSFLYKKLGIKDWNRFLEAYGMPTRLGRYGSNHSKQDQEALRRAVRNIQGDGSAIIPESMQLEFIQGQTNGKGAESYEKICSYLNKEISKLVLGQTMTSEDGASQSQATVHNEVRKDIIASDARRVCACIIEQLIKPYLFLNYGADVNMPKIALPLPQKEDLSTLADNITKLHGIGVEISVAQVREKFKLRIPTDDSDVVGGKQLPSVEKNMTRQMNNQSGEMADEDSLADELYNAMAGDDNPYAKAMQKFSEQYKDLEIMQKNMADMAKELNNPARDKMIEQTARGGFVANLNGQLDAQDEK